MYEVGSIHHLYVCYRFCPPYGRTRQYLLTSKKVVHKELREETVFDYKRNSEKQER
ncbi:hypothetical genomic island protein [Bartonella henselae str. Houston-1]|uniref:Hypothetical genomic island protein n=1 Tax=Bartonella henselae (strain ATCC 49882 / DSM 28221 / CCUG 30454 / Houston 1) TaxID=283166 RepID=A0A0H3LX84_BARHE|nr:hypothetical genomic island protein [Bartonella henselae str. Houston-1]